MTNTKFILISGKAQHGKDTTGDIFYKELIEKGYKVLITHYADLLKWMCKSYFNWDGNKDENGRSILQKVGTDVIRKEDPDFWVKWIISLIKLFPNEWDYVIIPDCRFPNEIDSMIAAFQYVTHIRVNRPGFVSPLTLEQQNHISETALDNYGYEFLLNNTSMNELRAQIVKIINELENIR